MRLVLIFAAATLMACSMHAFGATSASASQTTLQAADESSQPFSGRHGSYVTISTSNAGGPPGPTIWNEHEVGRQLSAYPVKIAAIYPAKLPQGKTGQLLILLGEHGLFAITQKISKAFTLHKGEQVIYVSSPYNGWNRVFPYNGPMPE